MGLRYSRRFAFFAMFASISQSLKCTESRVYVRTKGLEMDNQMSEYRETILCGAKCQLTPNCICFRVNANTSDACEAFVPKTDANSLHSDGYSYYAWDKFYDKDVKNIALKKLAYQSSVYEQDGVSYSADRAVDGNKNTDMFTAPYISHTKNTEAEADPYPWWQMDLKKEYLVYRVVVLNRNDFGHRLHDFEIRVGNSPMSASYAKQPFDRNALCAKYEGSNILNSEEKGFNCGPCPVQGKYVSLQIVSNCKDCQEPNINILTLAEVEVYGISL